MQRGSGMACVSCVGGLVFAPTPLSILRFHVVARVSRSLARMLDSVSSLCFYLTVYVFFEAFSLWFSIYKQFNMARILDISTKFPHTALITPRHNDDGPLSKLTTGMSNGCGSGRDALLAACGLPLPCWSSMLCSAAAALSGFAPAAIMAARSIARSFSACWR